MINKTFLLMLFAIPATLSTSCRKSPGYGGNNTVSGKILVKDYNGLGELISEYYAQNEQIYIVYGEGNTYDDNFKTSFDGSFEFNFLNKGKYMVFCYSDCKQCPNGSDSAVTVSFELEKNNQNLDLGEIIIHR